MSEYLLEVLLPFHIFDDYLLEAIESCEKALPPNSRIIAINTLNDQKMLNGHSGLILEVTCPKANYVTALKFGLSKTQSKYVALMNSDDLIDEHRFIKQIEALEQSNFNLCVTNLSKFSITKIHKSIEVPSLLGEVPNNFHEALLLLGSFRADASWCFNQKWAREVDLFGQKSDVSDWCTAMRTVKSTNTVVLNEKYYFYRMHARQITRDQKVSNSPYFYANWTELNDRLNFRALNHSEIDIVTSHNRTSKIENLENVWCWLSEIEVYLESIFIDSDKEKISNILFRRKLLIGIRNRSLQLKIKELRLLPNLFFQYFRFKKYLRGVL